jgi:hypothetical protein
MFESILFNSLACNSADRWLKIYTMLGDNKDKWRRILDKPYWELI